MLKTVVTLIALTALPVLSRPNNNNAIEKKPRGLNRRDGFDEWFWEIDSPTPSEFDASNFNSNAQSNTIIFDGRDSDDGGWFAVPTDLGAKDYFDQGAKNGYRLTNDTSSAIIWNLSSTLSFGDKIVHPSWNDTDDLPITLDFNGILGEFFPNTTSTFDQSEADPWDSTTSTTAVLSRSVTVQNSECNESINITLTTIDALGNEQVFNAVDNLSVSVPAALPANVSFVGVGMSTGEISGMALVFLDLEPVSYVLGNGPNVPIPSASLSAVAQYCPD